jgi:hypothetical protein
VKRKGKFKRRFYFLALSALLLMLYVYFSPYAVTEQGAIRDTFSTHDGKKVFEKQFGNKKVVILENDDASPINVYYVKVINKTNGILYRVTHTGAFSSHSVKSEKEKVRYTWSGSGRSSKDVMETIFAVKVLDDKIVKVAVSNDGDYENNLSLSKAKELSTLYFEMEVQNGYAAYIGYLDHAEVGSFVFRGLNSKGEIISYY